MVYTIASVQFASFKTNARFNFHSFQTGGPDQTLRGNLGLIPTIKY